jgi:hypothetical protein
MRERRCIKMSEATNPFDAVITDLKWLVSIGQRARTSDVAQIHAAIRVLEEWSRWAPLIEAAGKFLSIRGDSPRAIVDRMGATNSLLDACRAALPEKGEK